MEKRKIGGAKMEPAQDERTPLTGKGDEVKVKTTACSRIQAPLQSWLRPAMWIPGLNRLHSHKEVWKSTDSSPQKNMECVQRALVRVKQTDKSHSDFIVSKVEENFLQIHVFTRVEWLDVIEMKFEGNLVKISAFSSGILPLILPGACLLNVVFFWCPFLDWGMNQKRLKWILSHVDIGMEKCAD